MDVIVADIETNSLLIDATELHCIGIKDLRTGVSKVYTDSSSSYPSLSEAADRLQQADRVVFHNGLLFDRPCLEKFGIVLDWRKVYDTLVVSRLMKPRRDGGHSLENWGYKLGVHKGEFNDWSKFSPEMAAYLLQDLEVGAAVYQAVLKEARGFDRAVELEFEVTHRISQQIFNGFCFDRENAIKLNADLIREKEEVERQLQDVFPPILVANGPAKVAKVANKKKGIEKGVEYQNLKWEVFNPGSRPQIAKRLIRKYGWKPKSFTPSGQVEINETILQELPYEECKPLLAYLAADKKCSMVAGWLDAERNGRIHGSVNPQGAATGRMTHSDPNVAQADSDHRMRRLWKPRKGWKLMGADGDALELRMMGHYLHRYDGGAFARSVDQGKKQEGTDPHTINQKLVGLYDRDSAKTFVYALIYGAGDPKLGKIIIEDADAAGKPRPKGSLAALGKRGRTALEKGIVGLEDLKKKLQFKVKKHGFFIGLDGRRVYTDSLHACLNYLFQGAGAIVMKVALVLFCRKAEEAYGPHGLRWAQCANVHDEFQVECEPEIAEGIAKLAADAIREAGEVLNIRCPVKAGPPAIGENWSETH